MTNTIIPVAIPTDTFDPCRRCGSHNIVVHLRDGKWSRVCLDCRRDREGKLIWQQRDRGEKDKDEYFLQEQ